VVNTCTEATRTLTILLYNITVYYYHRHRSYRLRSHWHRHRRCRVYARGESCSRRLLEKRRGIPPGDYILTVLICLMNNLRATQILAGLINSSIFRYETVGSIILIMYYIRFILYNVLNIYRAAKYERETEDRPDVKIRSVAGKYNI